ncbi:hypothetical protein MMC14_004825 [Varicellaria rhodocarpa]|nr:hypothetical protein [Varicellaria rhodocarpa]
MSQLSADIELASASTNPSKSPNRAQGGWRKAFLGFVPSVIQPASDYIHRSKTCEHEAPQVEDFRPGYPRYSTLIGSDDSFQIYRRFSILRTRLLLQKQDRLSLLEKELERIDEEEIAPLFLGSVRFDRNIERQKVLSDIDDALADYDTLVKRNNTMLEFRDAIPRDISSLKHWVEGNASLARDETAYLERDTDLMSVVGVEDNALSRLLALLEHFLVRNFKRFRKNASFSLSRDPNVYIFSGSALKRITRSLIASLVVFILLVPVIVLNAIDGVAIRMVVIVISSAFLITMLSILTKAKTGEVFMAGATYATVLVVFVAGNGPGPA